MTCVNTSGATPSTISSDTPILAALVMAIDKASQCVPGLRL